MSSLAAAPWFVLDLKETGSTVFPPGSNKCLPPIATIIMFFMGNSLEGDKGEGRGGGRDRKGTQSQMLLAGLQWDNLSGGQPGSLSALILCQGANPRGNTSGMLRVYEDTRLCQNGKNAQAIHVTRRPTHREHLCSAVPCNQKKTHSYGQGHATQQGLKKFHLCKKHAPVSANSKQNPHRAPGGVTVHLSVRKGAGWEAIKQISIPIPYTRFHQKRHLVHMIKDKNCL